MGGTLDELKGHLLIQCPPGHAVAAAEIANTYGAGLVLTGRKSEQMARVLRGRDFKGPLLCDADRYSGNQRVDAQRGIRPAWCRRQRDLDLMPLTDSGYLATGDWRGLRSVLRAAAAQPMRVIAMLPLAAAWFRASAVCNALIEHLNTFQVPVAVAIERKDDPFGAKYLVRGFLRLLRDTTVPVLLLRSDVSALGALCHGAHTSAIGTTSTLRHIYPITPGSPPPRPSISAFVTPLLSYHKLDTIEQIVANTPDLSQLWPCRCPVCSDSTPARLDKSDHPVGDAFRHSLHAQLRLHAELTGRLRTREALVSTWHEHCSHALALHEQIKETIPGWRTPEGLSSWHAVTEDPLSTRRGIPTQARARDPRLTDQ